MKIVLIFVILILAVTVGFFVIRPNVLPQSPSAPTPTSLPHITQGPTGAVHCEPEQLSGSIITEPAAGNVYGTLTLTNIGTVPCNVTLGKSIAAVYAAKNITLRYESEPNPEEITLEPSEKAYSQIHYPNGPQCSSTISQQKVTFHYEVDGKTVTFKQGNQDAVTIQACSSASDVTTLDIWPLSQQPITQ